MSKMANNIFGGNIQPAVPSQPTVRPVTGTPVIGTQSSWPNGGNMQQPSTEPVNNAPQTNVHYVADMQEMLSYPAGPNEHMYFPESDSNIIWLRETDGNGRIKNPVTRLTCTEDEVPFGPEANFVTKQEHQQLYNLVADMAETVNWLKNELGGNAK